MYNLVTKAGTNVLSIKTFVCLENIEIIPSFANMPTLMFMHATSKM